MPASSQVFSNHQSPSVLPLPQSHWAPTRSFGSHWAGYLSHFRGEATRGGHMRRAALPDWAADHIEADRVGAVVDISDTQVELIPMPRKTAEDLYMLVFPASSSQEKSRILSGEPCACDGWPYNL